MTERQQQVYFAVLIVIVIVAGLLGIDLTSGSCYDTDPRVEAACEANQR